MDYVPGKVFVSIGLAPLVMLLFTATACESVHPDDMRQISKPERPESFVGVFSGRDQGFNFPANGLWGIFFDFYGKLDIEGPSDVRIESPTRDGFVVVRLRDGREVDRQTVSWSFRDGYYFACRPIFIWVAPWPLIVFGSDAFGMGLDDGKNLVISRYSGGSSFPLLWGAEGHEVHVFLRAGNDKATPRNAHPLNWAKSKGTRTFYR